MANHRKACRFYSAGRHQQPVFLRLIRLIVTIFNQIRPTLSRGKSGSWQKNERKVEDLYYTHRFEDKYEA